MERLDGANASLAALRADTKRKRNVNFHGCVLRKELDSCKSLGIKEIAGGTCSDCFNSFKVTKLMRGGNCGVSDERTGSHGLKLWKETQTQTSC